MTVMVARAGVRGYVRNKSVGQEVTTSGETRRVEMRRVLLVARSDVTVCGRRYSLISRDVRLEV